MGKPAKKNTKSPPVTKTIRKSTRKTINSSDEKDTGPPPSVAVVKRGRPKITQAKLDALLFTEYLVEEKDTKSIGKIDRMSFYAELTLNRMAGSTKERASYVLKPGSIVAVWAHSNVPYVINAITANEGNIMNAKLSLQRIDTLKGEPLPAIPADSPKTENIMETSVAFSNVYHLFEEECDITPAFYYEKKKKEFAAKKAAARVRTILSYLRTIFSSVSY